MTKSNSRNLKYLNDWDMIHFGYIKSDLVIKEKLIIFIQHMSIKKLINVSCQ